MNADTHIISAAPAATSARPSRRSFLTAAAAAAGAALAATGASVAGATEAAGADSTMSALIADYLAKSAEMDEAWAEVDAIDDAVWESLDDDPVPLLDGVVPLGNGEVALDTRGRWNCRGRLSPAEFAMLDAADRELDARRQRLGLPAADRRYRDAKAEFERACGRLCRARPRTFDEARARMAFLAEDDRWACLPEDQQAALFRSFGSVDGGAA